MSDKWVDADALKEKIGNTAFLKLDDTEVVEQFIDTAPSIDLVFCKECKWRDHIGCALKIVDDSDKPNDDDFCSYGEREGE